MSTPDLFWQWSAAPGALVPHEKHGAFTITGSNGGSHYILWYYDRVFASGQMSMIKGVLDKRLYHQQSFAPSPGDETR